MYQNLHGRFTAVDPLLASGKSADPQTFNRYVYVGNNPLIMTDPTGLIWGKNGNNEVRWFDKKLGKGFSEFTPDNWQYEGAGGRTIQLDATSSKWDYINPVEVVGGPNPTQDLVQAAGQSLSDAITGMEIGARNLVTDGINTLTQPFGSTGAALGIPNPFAIDPIPYGTAKQAAYGFITQTSITTMATAGAGSLAAGPASVGSSLSIVPEAQQMSRGAQMITELVGRPGQATGTLNNAGDLVITGRQFKFRVDLRNPGNDAPHMHLEQLINGKWRDAVRGTHRIYPEP